MSEPLATTTTAIHELAQAWKRLHLYPSGHPERANVSQRAVDALRTAIGEGQALALGVTREGFVVAEKVHTDLGAKELANVLYRRNVAVVRVNRLVSVESFEDFLSSIGTITGSFPAQTLDDDMPTQSWPGIRLENADYSALLAAEEQSPEELVQRLTLWERILKRQLLDLRGTGDPAASGMTAETLERILNALPAEMINRDYKGSFPQQVDQIIDVLRVAVLEHLKEAVSRRELTELDQVHELLEGLPAGVAISALERCLADLADDDDHKVELGALVAALDADLALAAVRRLRDRGFGFSPSALETVRDLADRAETESAKAPSEVPTALRILVDEGRDAAPLVPYDAPTYPFGRASAAMAQWPQSLESVRTTLQPGAVQLGVLNAMCELLAQPHVHERGARALVPRLEELFGDLVETGHPMAAVAVLHALRDLRVSHSERLERPLTELLQRITTATLGARIVRMLPAAEERLVSQLQTLVGALGPDMVSALVTLLAEEDDRTQRRALFDFLKNFRAEVLPAAREGLSDPRWFVVRNMIGLLDEIEDRGSVPLLRRVVLHSDLRVRTAALRALVHMDRALPESTIRAVLDSADPSFVERTLLLLGRAELPTAVEPIGDLLRKGSSASRGVRLRALEALGLLGDARSLEVIRPLLGGLRLTNIEERRAAYRALAGLPREVGEPLLKKGLRARDAEIQATCEQALATHGSAPTEPKR